MKSKHEMTKEEYMNIYRQRFIELRGREMTIQDIEWVEQDWELAVREHQRKRHS